MITWTQRSDGWHGNGYRIELVKPAQWVLLDNSTRPDAQVNTEPQPLATGHTLTECKREAELRHSAGHRADLRRRHGALLFIIAATAMLAMNPSAPRNIVVDSALALAAIRSVGIVIGTVFWRLRYSNADMIYQ